MAKKTGAESKNKISIRRLLLGISIPLLIALFFILYLSWPLIAGKKVVLATMPVDPFDVLRGQYIIINYEINMIPYAEGSKVGDDVYVTLSPDQENIHRYLSSSIKKPNDGVFITGKIINILEDTMVVEYGIEQFFFERNAEFLTTNLNVEVKIDRTGQARISRLLKDGKPIEINYQKPSIAS